MNSALIFNYFPELSSLQKEQINKLEFLYQDWNAKINVVSRKDIDELYLRHVLHSLAIAKYILFKPGTSILDVGTGGGFPAIPLAIFFPQATFMAVDPIGKKIKVVNDVINALELTNIEAKQIRVENVKGQYDFVISRAVAAMPSFMRWIDGKIAPGGFNSLKNGVLYLKGGDLTQELKDFPAAVTHNLNEHFREEFFETKKLVYLPYSA